MKRMQRQCKISGETFEIFPDDLKFYEMFSPVIAGIKYQLPSPLLCPEERRRRRIAFRNERKFYHRKCDLTGKEVISVYSPDKPYRVYAQSEWWSDRWDAQSYGRDFDFNKTFFEQFDLLLKEVPRVALINFNSENCEYTNIAADNKNCYILIESSNNEECHYCSWMQICRDCIDCAFCYESELCYEVTDSFNCYNLSFSENCKNCHDSAFLKNCQGCHDCFGCINLRQKSYYIFNKAYTKEEYFKKIKEYDLRSYKNLVVAQKSTEAFFSTQAHKYAFITNAENCVGDYISNSKNCFDCYHAHQAEDCRYSVHVWRNSKNNMDTDTCGRNAELNYECINTGIDVFGNIFCITCWSSKDLMYCDTCHSSSNCFGSVGLRRKQYCIFNKQYTKDEYEKLLPKIIEHLRKTGEWGEYFPAAMSFFGYNESVAQEYFPLTKAEALARGYKWKDEENFSRYKGKNYPLPDNVNDASDEISRAVLSCEENGKPYKIIPQELIFYRKLGIALPRLCYEQRHLKRLSSRNPRKLWQRKCSQCKTALHSALNPETIKEIYCESCYEKLIL